jgi:hypothetical protein
VAHAGSAARLPATSLSSFHGRLHGTELGNTDTHVMTLLSFPNDLQAQIVPEANTSDGRTIVEMG